MVGESTGRSSFYHFLSLAEPFPSGPLGVLLAMHAPVKGTACLVVTFLVWITCQPWATANKMYKSLGTFVCGWLHRFPEHSVLPTLFWRTLSRAACFYPPFCPLCRGVFAFNLLKCFLRSPSISLISFLHNPLFPLLIVKPAQGRLWDISKGHNTPETGFQVPSSFLSRALLSDTSTFCQISAFFFWSSY